MRLVRLSLHPDNRGIRGEVGPQNSVRTKKVTPVSRRTEMDYLDTMMTTRGSLIEMAEVRPRKLRLPQLSMPKRSVRGQSGPDIHMP